MIAMVSRRTVPPLVLVGSGVAERRGRVDPDGSGSFYAIAAQAAQRASASFQVASAEDRRFSTVIPAGVGSTKGGGRNPRSVAIGAQPHRPWPLEDAVNIEGRPPAPSCGPKRQYQNQPDTGQQRTAYPDTEMIWTAQSMGGLVATRVADYATPATSNEVAVRRVTAIPHRKPST